MLGLVVSFFTRKVFIDYLGIEFMGLTGTLQSLLGFLNVAELGVGTAIAYLLYKPIFEDDKEKITEIISVLGYLYRTIGLTILGAGVVLSIFLPWIFDDTSFSMPVIYFGFYAFLASSLFAYFFNYKLSLLSADQRNYIVTGYFKIIYSAKCLLQMVLVIYYQSFILYFTLEIVCGLINSYILNIKIRKTYPWLESNIKLGRKLLKKYPEIGKNIRWLFVHKIAGFVQYQITPFLIYAFVSLPVVGIYGNYVLINDALKGFICGILDSTAAGIGNLISEGNMEKILRSFRELFSVRFLISGIISSSVYILISPFISTWLGDDMVLPNLVVALVCLQYFFLALRGTTDQFIGGYGLFYDIWAPLTEAALFVGSAIAFGSIWGLPGVLMGPILSMTIIIFIWKPYFLFRKGLKVSVWRYWRLFAINLIVFAAAFIAAYNLQDIISQAIQISNDWLKWIIDAITFAIIISTVGFILFYTLVPGIRSFTHRFINRKK